jgi:hypothetical protein
VRVSVDPGNAPLIDAINGLQENALRMQAGRSAAAPPACAPPPHSAPLSAAPLRAVPVEVATDETFGEARGEYHAAVAVAAPAANAWPVT